eukprot:gnl/Hemi2/16136_TR5358_c1_g1_i1.p1 gnl/Hemi2/16136_TR5358_c1_g1~~gnl/Hemi2/16136_TR5358_c1_g1_i1.p1  ORF type:complete len:372 (+),score=122.70 gnl/Hemi2/16136_TR5358_c1_g1_i1:69-1118(+)
MRASIVVVMVALALCLFAQQGSCMHKKVMSREEEQVEIASLLDVWDLFVGIEERPILSTVHEIRLSQLREMEGQLKQVKTPKSAKYSRESPMPFWEWALAKDFLLDTLRTTIAGDILRNNVEQFKFLNRHKFTFTPIKADGNCFFLAVARALTGPDAEQDDVDVLARYLRGLTQVSGAQEARHVADNACPAPQDQENRLYTTWCRDARDNTCLFGNPSAARLLTRAFARLPFAIAADAEEQPAPPTDHPVNLRIHIINAEEGFRQATFTAADIAGSKPDCLPAVTEQDILGSLDAIPTAPFNGGGSSDLLRAMRTTMIPNPRVEAVLLLHSKHYDLLVPTDPNDLQRIW